MGYIFFDVNGKKYFNYNKALEARKKEKGSVCFKGFNIFYPFSGFWRTFYLRTKWMSYEDDRFALEHNLVFKTKKEAIARAKELLGIEEKK